MFKWPAYLTAALITIWNKHPELTASIIAKTLTDTYAVRPALTRCCVLGKVWRLREQGYILAGRGDRSYNGAPMSDFVE